MRFEAGDLKFDLEILEEFTKVSFIYHPDGLQMECEPY